MSRPRGALVAIAGLSGVLACWLLPTPARACSGCVEFAAAPQSSTMPADLAGLRRVPADLTEVVLLDLTDDLEIPIAMTSDGDIHPTQALVVGHEHRFELGPRWCAEGILTVEFTATDPQASSLDPAPALGDLAISAASRGVVGSPGSPACSESIEVLAADISLALNPAIAGFEPLLLYSTLIDGERWSYVDADFAPLQVGRSWIGRGVDRVFTRCPDGSEGLTPGLHEVQMIAQIAGLPGVVFASPVATVDLDCALFEAPGDDAGESDGGESGDFVTPIDDPDSRGCGCVSAGSDPGSQGGPRGGLVLLLALAWRRRRATR